jgi:hypothetical protein
VQTRISFDDSIIEDANAAAERTLKLVAGGLKSRKRAIMELSHCSEAEAERQLAEITAETRGRQHPAQARIKPQNRPAGAYIRRSKALQAQSRYTYASLWKLIHGSSILNHFR